MGSLLKTIREAIRGEGIDATKGPLGRAIVLLAIPMVLEMCMESLFGIVDIYWVARLGTEAAAAVGVTESLMTVLYAVAMGIAMATTAMVARRIGEKDEEGAAGASVQAIGIGVLTSFLIAMPGVLYAPELLAMMGADRAVIESGVIYTRVILGSSISVMMLFLMNAIFRGAGDAAIAMRVLWFANGLNLILDPLLIFGLGPVPAMGVTGAAVATAIGRTAGVVMQIMVLTGVTSRIKLRRRHWKPDWPVMRRLSRISATGMLQFLIAHASWVALVRIIAISGAAALAGYTIAIRIVIFTILPSWGLSNSAATMVGQNLGARQPDRAEKAVWMTGLYNMVFLAGIGLVCVAIPEYLVRLFTSEPDVVRYGAECLRIISYGYLFYAVGMVLVQAFNGAGDTTTPTLINLGVYWMFQLPMAWWLGLKLGLGAMGAFWAVPIAESVLTLVGWWVFRRGGWKKQAI